MMTTKEMAIDFAVQIFNTCKNFNDIRPYVNQILRSSSSIGANLHEATYAQSKADFISKLEISLKETYETEYWLELLNRIKKLPDKDYNNLKATCGTIRRKIIASVTTTKKNSK